MLGSPERTRELLSLPRQKPEVSLCEKSVWCLLVAKMFSTPRTTTGNSRRSLEFNRASSTQRTTNQESGQGTSESSGQNGNHNNSSTNEDVLTVLRSLQQQVSTIQAQQNRDRSERHSTSTPSSSLNDKRKLPKELTVSQNLCFVSCFLHGILL